VGRKLWAVLAAAVTIGSFAGAVGAAPAQAAQGCGGRLIGQHTLFGNFAQVDVYLENGTTNCLVNRTRGNSWGKARGMGIMVSTRNSDIPTAEHGNLCKGMTTTATRKADCKASYRYYAGPVRVYAPHACLYFTATVGTPQGITGTKFKNFHCG